jgi:hypothetical protein
MQSLNFDLHQKDCETPLLNSTQMLVTKTTLNLK